MGSLKNKSRVIRQHLFIKHTQIKARQPRLSGGCKSMHRLKQNRQRKFGRLSENDIKRIYC